MSLNSVNFKKYLHVEKLKNKIHQQLLFIVQNSCGYSCQKNLYTTKYICIGVQNDSPKALLNIWKSTKLNSIISRQLARECRLYILTLIC